MIITRTPFRMSFFVGGTDMEDYLKENGGAVLSTTFDKCCYINVRHLPRFFDYRTEFSYSVIERVTAEDDIRHPLIKNAMKMLDMHEIRLTYEADLPVRSGFGTSSSFAVGMLKAFYALKGKYADKRKLADETEKILTDKHSDLDEFGRLLDISWQFKKKTGKTISTDMIYELYKKEMAAGSLGGKLLGAGGGYNVPYKVDATRRRDCLKCQLPPGKIGGGIPVLRTR